MPSILSPSAEKNAAIENLSGNSGKPLAGEDAVVPVEALPPRKKPYTSKY